MHKVFSENEVIKQQNEQQRNTINEMKIVISEQKNNIDELLQTIKSLEEEQDTVMIEANNNDNENNHAFSNKIVKLQKIIDDQKLELLQLKQENENSAQKLMNLEVYKIEN